MTKQMQHATIGLYALLESAPRAAALLEREGVLYLGPCVVQAPGAWTRVGPTWRIPDIGYLVVGPGARQWGTTLGLAELATLDSARPTWHAAGIAIVEAPNIVYAMTTAALGSEYMADVRRLADEVEA